MVAYSSILYAPSIQLSPVEVLVSIFGNVIQVCTAKFHPKAMENISIQNIVQNHRQHNNFYCIKKFIANRISDHIILPITTIYLKKIIKHNVILGIGDRYTH